MSMFFSSSLMAQIHIALIIKDLLFEIFGMSRHNQHLNIQWNLNGNYLQEQVVLERLYFTGNTNGILLGPNFRNVPIRDCTWDF